MSKFNDYSGFNQIFRDTLLGVALSAGGLSTLLPNLLETVSQAGDLDTFRALNLFSVVYFILPVLICTTYWLTGGVQRFSVARLLPEERAKYLEQHASEASGVMNREVVQVSTAILSGLKLLPVFYFLYDQSLAGQLPPAAYGIYYALLAIAEIHYVTRLTSEIANSSSRPGFPASLKEKGFRLNVLIFTLDMFIGLSLAVFIQPWILYTPELYVYCTIAVSVYALIAIGIHWRVNKPTGLPTEIIFAGFLIVTIGACVPAVNLRWMDTIPWVNYALVTGIVFLLVGKLRRLTDYFRILFPAAMLILMFVFIKKSYPRMNKTYYHNRIDAAKQMPQDKLFPFYAFHEHADSTFEYAREKARQANAFNNRLIATPAALRSHGPVDTLLMKYNTRKIYYGKYDELIRAGRAREVVTQDSLNVFYEDLLRHLNEEVFARYLKGCRGEKLMKEDDSLKRYSHPIDFYAGYLSDEKTLLDKNKELVEYIRRIRAVRLALLEPNFDRRDTVIIHNLKLYHDRLHVLLKNTIRNIDDLDARAFMFSSSDSLLTEKGKIDDEMMKRKIGDGKLREFLRKDSLAGFYKSMAATRLLGIEEYRYADVYKGGQRIYRSYLADSQRIGVYTFATALIILSFALYYAHNDEKETQNPSSKSQSSSFGPKQIFFIQVLSILLLLVPLMRPISPENIDPIKPYWMMTLQNWYAPTFTAKLGGQEKFTPEDRGGTSVKGLEEKLMETNGLLKDIGKQLEDIDDKLKKQSTYRQ